MSIFDKWKEERTAQWGGTKGSTLLSSVMQGSWSDGKNHRQSLKDYFAQKKPLTNGSLYAQSAGNGFIIYTYAQPLAIVSPNENKVILRGRKFSVTSSRHATLVRYAATPAMNIVTIPEENDEQFLDIIYNFKDSGIVSTPQEEVKPSVPMDLSSEQPDTEVPENK